MKHDYKYSVIFGLENNLLTVSLKDEFNYLYITHFVLIIYFVRIAWIGSETIIFFYFFEIEYAFFGKNIFWGQCLNRIDEFHHI